MTVDPTVKLSTLSAGDTFLIGDAGWAVNDPQTLPAPAPGQVWITNLVNMQTAQNPGTIDVIPVPLKVVHA